jgi:hypothetical protein
LPASLGPQVAILQVVFDIQLLRRRKSIELQKGQQGQQGGGVPTTAASSATSVGSTM